LQNIKNGYIYVGMSSFFQIFRERIKKELLKRNWTQSDLAKKCGMQQHISSMLKSREHKRINEDHVEAIATAFQLDLIELFTPSYKAAHTLPPELQELNDLYLNITLLQKRRELVPGGYSREV